MVSYFTHKHMYQIFLRYCSNQIFSMAFGQNWTLKVKVWLYHFIAILSSMSCLFYPYWVHQNPEDACETYRAGYMILHGSFGEQQLLTTGTGSTGVSVFSFTLSLSIIRILLKCHAVIYIHPLYHHAT